MPLSNQAKLLSVLQNQEVLRVGSLQPHRVDVRIIAATNRNLRAAVREDLYYCVAMVEINMPPLAARKGDLPLLTPHFIEKFSVQFGKRIRGLTARAELALARDAWSGNVRQLENAIGHGCIMAEGDVIDIWDLPLPITGTADVATIPPVEIRNHRVERRLRNRNGN